MLYLIIFVGVIASSTPSSNNSMTSTAPYFVMEKTDSSSSSQKEAVKQVQPGEAAYQAGHNLRWTENKPEEAFQQFISAAKEEHAGALWAVATMATHGIGCPVDIELARDCYSVLEDDSQALNNLGALYEFFILEGEDRKNCLEKAKEYYQKAQKLGLENASIGLNRVEKELSSS